MQENKNLFIQIGIGSFLMLNVLFSIIGSKLLQAVKSK